MEWATWMGSVCGVCVGVCGCVYVCGAVRVSLCVCMNDTEPDSVP